MIWRDNQNLLVYFVWAVLVAVPWIQAYIAPKMTRHPGDALGVEGKRLVLSCRASGNPTPVYTWSKNNNEVNMTGTRVRVTNGDLIFSEFKKTDVGVYHCIVRVSMPTFELKLISRSARVATPVTPSKLQKDIQPVSAYTGGSMRFSVDVLNFVPPPQITWNYRGKPTITSSDSRFVVLPNGALQVSGLTFQENGELRAVIRPRDVCGVKTGASLVFGEFQKIDILPANSRPASKDFYFLATPQSIDLKWGESFILEVLADSANPVTYTWYKNGQPIQLGGKKSIIGQGNLKILYPKFNDAGNYKVVARSGGKTIEATANINIMDAPRFTATPTTRVNGQESGTAKFDFKLLGLPKPKVVWYHNGVIMNVAQIDYATFANNYMQIDDLTLADHGMYQGFATNFLGMAEITTELVVLRTDACVDESSPSSCKKQWHNTTQGKQYKMNYCRSTCNFFDLQITLAESTNALPTKKGLQATLVKSISTMLTKKDIRGESLTKLQTKHIIIIVTCVIVLVLLVLLVLLLLIRKKNKRRKVKRENNLGISCKSSNIVTSQENIYEDIRRPLPELPDNPAKTYKLNSMHENKAISMKNQSLDYFLPTQQQQRECCYEVEPDSEDTYLSLKDTEDAYLSPKHGVNPDVFSTED